MAQWIARRFPEPKAPSSILGAGTHGPVAEWLRRQPAKLDTPVRSRSGLPRHAIRCGVHYADGPAAGSDSYPGFARFDTEVSDRYQSPVDTDQVSLYDRTAALPDGARALAQARLRSAVAGALWDACDGMPPRPPRRWRRSPLDRAGRIRVDELAGFLHDRGFELEVRLVPAGQPRAEAVGDVA